MAGCLHYAATNRREKAIPQRYERLVIAIDSMSELLVQFDEPQLSADGRMFTAEVRANRLTSGLWEAWIEFQPRIGGEPVRTRRETEQLSRGDLRFWAAGITRDYLRDALVRALSPQEMLRAEATTPSSDAGESSEHDAGEAVTYASNDETVLDPFTVYRNSGEYTLRQELRALDARQLAGIIGKYHIPDMDVIDLARTYEDALAERIVADVQHNVGSKRTPVAQRETSVEK